MSDTRQTSSRVAYETTINDVDYHITRVQDELEDYIHDEIDNQSEGIAYGLNNIKDDIHVAIDDAETSVNDNINNLRSGINTHVSTLSQKIEDNAGDINRNLIDNQAEIRRRFDDVDNTLLGVAETLENYQADSTAALTGAITDLSTQIDETGRKTELHVAGYIDDQETTLKHALLDTKDDINTQINLYANDIVNRANDNTDYIHRNITTLQDNLDSKLSDLETGLSTDIDNITATVSTGILDISGVMILLWQNIEEWLDNNIVLTEDKLYELAVMRYKAEQRANYELSDMYKEVST